MAGKVTRMSKIKQLLRLHRQGVSNRGIGRELGLYKATVNSYIDKLKLHGYDIEQLLELEDPVLEGKSSVNPVFLYLFQLLTLAKKQDLYAKQ